MKYDLEDTKSSPAVETLSPLQLAELNNEIMEAYENLTDSVKELDAVQEIMENIQTSQQLLAKHGASAIPQLNLDKGLEALCKVPENLITAQMAVTALEDNNQSMWAKFWEAIKAFFRKIVAFVKMLFNQGLGWDGKSMYQLKATIDAIDIVMDNIFRFQGGVFNGVLTKKAYTDLPAKIVAYLGLAAKLVDDTQDIIIELKSALTIHGGAEIKEGRGKLIRERFVEINNKFNTLNATFHSEVAKIFGNTGPEMKVGLFDFNFKFRNWISSKPEYEKGGLVSVSLKNIGFSTKADFLDAYNGLKTVVDAIEKDYKIKSIDDYLKKRGDEILALQPLVAGLRAVSTQDTDFVVANQRGIHEFVRRLYQCNRTAASWTADAIAVKKGMEQQFGVMLKACASKQSASTISSTANAAEKKDDDNKN